MKRTAIVAHVVMLGTFTGRGVRAQGTPAELPPIVIESGPDTAATNAPTPPPDANATVSPNASTRVALVDAVGMGVDPTVSTYVTGVLRREITQLGFALVPADEVNAAAQRLQVTVPIASERLADLARETHASFAITAEIRAGGGYYYPTIRTRVEGEHGERFRQLFATQWTLGDAITAIVPTMLAPAGTLTAGPVEITPPVLPDMYTVQPPPRLLPVKVHTQPFELGATLLFAGNPGQDGFLNVLAGARAAWFPLDRFGLTAGFAYANLQGRTTRVSNVHPSLGVETAVDLVPSARIFLPFRAELGYLPLNGPTVRGTAALRFPLAGDVHLEVGIGATVWVLPGSATVSLDGGLQILYAFGANHTATANTTAPSTAPATPHRRRRRTNPATETTAPAPASAP